ncbi:MAG: glycosyltransferase family 9 protein [Bdellovibrionota bacterium]|nr:MAG: glycosyltransferase family 9 protein [Bdellovibrionota bacterium]
MSISFHARQTIDHMVGGPIAWLLNMCARMLGAILGRDHSLQSPPRRVLVMKFVGLGSIVRASFLLRELRERYPDAHIIFLTFPGCVQLVKMFDEVDEVKVIRDGSLFSLTWDVAEFVLYCIGYPIDLVIDLEVHSKFSSIMTALSRGRDRAGFAGVTSRFRRGLYTHLVFWNPTEYVDRAYQQLGRSLGLDGATQPLQPRLTVKDEAECFAWMQAQGISPKATMIGINPNASDMKEERRWPEPYIIDLIRALPAERGIVVVLVGSKAERERAERIRAACAGSSVTVCVSAGALSIAAFCVLLQQLKVFITNDSGPLHLARLFDTPTISLWGPTNPEQYNPRAGSKSIELYEPIYCSPCTHFSDEAPCGGNNQCLKRISWQRVYQSVAELAAFHVPASVSAHRGPGYLFDPSLVHGYWHRETVPLPRIRPALVQVGEFSGRNGHPYQTDKAKRAVGDERD